MFNIFCFDSKVFKNSPPCSEIQRPSLPSFLHFLLVLLEITYQYYPSMSFPPLKDDGHFAPPIHQLFRFDYDSLNDSRKRRYDVFLSFRGEDTRASFISHLFPSLQNSGIIVFKDDHSLPRGARISKSLLHAIEESRICVIVFSLNYADSPWCIQELVQIIQCHRTIGLAVLPVFYYVKPSEVRHQTGEFGKAFQNLIEEHEYMSATCRDALHEAAGLAGFVVLNSRLLTYLSAF